MIIWFVRHGESEATVMGDRASIQHDLPLAGIGKEKHEEFTMRTGGIARYDSERGTVVIVSLHG